MITKIALFFLVPFFGEWAQAQTQYKPTDAGSTVKFRIKNLGIGVDGSFTGLLGDIRFDPTRPTDADFEVSVDAATVNTDNNMRDDHLRRSDYFDAKAYPQIRLSSTKIRPSNKANAFFLYGKLTIKGHTKDIAFPFTATPSGKGWLFDGSFIINRRDFDVGGASIISDKLEVSLHVVAN